MEIRDLNQLSLQFAKKTTEDAIKRFIRNDSQNRTGVWEYITGYTLINGKLEKNTIYWNNFFKWFKDRNWQLCHFDTFENDRRGYGFHQWVFEPVDEDIALYDHSVMNPDINEVRRSIEKYFEEGIEVSFISGFIFVTERWES